MVTSRGHSSPRILRVGLGDAFEVATASPDGIEASGGIVAESLGRSNSACWGRGLLLLYAAIGGISRRRCPWLFVRSAGRMWRVRLFVRSAGRRNRRWRLLREERLWLRLAAILGWQKMWRDC